MEGVLWVKKKSKDPSTQVGAILVGPNHEPISFGYNGPPRKTSDRLTSRESKLRRTLHAESNAIDFAKTSLEGCTIYISAPPCSQCTARIIQNGIFRAVFYPGDMGFRVRWAEDIAESVAMAEESGLILEEFML